LFTTPDHHVVANVPIDLDTHCLSFDPPLTPASSVARGTVFPASKSISISEFSAPCWAARHPGGPAIFMAVDMSLQIPVAHYAWAFSLCLPPVTGETPVYHQFMAVVPAVPQNVGPMSRRFQLFDGDAFIFFVNADADLPRLEAVQEHHLHAVASALASKGPFIRGSVALHCTAQTVGNAVLYANYFIL